MEFQPAISLVKVPPEPEKNCSNDLISSPYDMAALSFTPTNDLC